MTMLSKTKALELLDRHLKTEVLKKHCIASGVIMRALAEKFGENPENWEVIGLLHDLDFDSTRDAPERHTVVTKEILAGEGFSAEVLKAIQAHNEATGITRETRLEFALAAAESITGLIVACALVYPDKKISSVKPKSIKKRMKERAFARNVSRESIMECEKMGMSLDDFIQISLTAMSQIENELM